jgi:hypothetical protein
MANFIDLIFINFIDQKYFLFIDLIFINFIDQKYFYLLI